MPDAAADHPMLRGDTVEHPAPTATRGMPTLDPTTPDGAAARIGNLLRRKPDLDPGRPESLKPDAEPAPDANEPDPEPTELETQPRDEVVQEPDGEDTPQQDAETSDSNDDTASDSEQITLDSEQLSEILGVPVEVDDDGKLSVLSKVDGETGKATLDDLLTGYQSVESLKKRQMAVAEKDKAIEGKIESLDQAVQGNHMALAALMSAAQEALNPFANINWDQLRSEEPERYGVLKADQHEWEQRIGSILQQANQQLINDRSAVQTEREQRLFARHAEQGELLLKAIPDWSTEKLSEVDRYARETYGMSPEDLQAISHHHGFTVMAHKAMLLDRGKQKIQAREVKKVPKVQLKPPARRSATAAMDGKIGGLRTALKKSGKPEAFVEYIRAVNQRNSSRNR